MDHRLGKSDALEHPLRITADAPISRLGEADKFQKLLHTGTQGFPTEAAELPVEGDRLCPREEFVEVGILG